MRSPRATYRIQFTPDFGFRAAGKILGYLTDLGVSDIYASPVFMARKGSPHGYDVVDHSQLNRELGGEDEFVRLLARVGEIGMGWIQDFVPNHASYSSENKMLMDVLENGERSRYYRFFDVEWDHSLESLRGKILAPFLGCSFGEALEKGEIKLVYGETGLCIRYFDLELPVRPESYTQVLARGIGRLRERLGEEHPDLIKYLGGLFVIRGLPSGEEEGAERNTLIRFAKRMLWEIYRGNSEIRRLMNRNVQAFNGMSGHPERVQRMEGLLSEQFFRLSFWKVAAEEINYRRFFNINELISLKMEDEAVRERTHALVFRLLDEGKISGLRIDHVDGLYDPAGYLDFIREKAPGAYLVVEKILAREERLPACWPVQGTTGYDFLNCVNGLFCRRSNEKAFDRIYGRFGGQAGDYHDLVSEKQRLIVERVMVGDVDNLSRLLERVSGRFRYRSDITFNGLRRAIIEVLANFPVYRTYLSPSGVSPQDRTAIEEAVSRAKIRMPDLAKPLDFIGDFLLSGGGESGSEEERRDWAHFAMRFQQVTGPVMAKGFEDTLLYVFDRLISLNEVGGYPDTFGVSREDFHSFNRVRATSMPMTLNATSTHDTKRGEDVRARIHVLSEVPREWRSHLKTWSLMNRSMKVRSRGQRSPDANDEYFLYQTLIGAFPFGESGMEEFPERLKGYLVKAVREAKVHTAWLKPDSRYEEAFLDFVERILDPSPENPFLQDFLPFQRRIAFYGVFNALSQTLLKITSPGVPDFYQGSELWDLSLVDPDNRRPVDYGKIAAMLDELKRRSAGEDLKGLISDLFSRYGDGAIKLYLVWKGLQARQERESLFREGDYLPLPCRGKWKDNIVAFARCHDHEWGLCLAPRFLTELVEEGTLPVGQETWGNTVILLPKGAPEAWTNPLTGEVVESKGQILAGEAMVTFPGALLLS